ncbi:hypothetical protein [Streptomyces sp. NPDC093707]|uniref:hypothetical protein n=1 Tax=Streptomyces sp. NPDC093707 TaxID=3154984 RepID=UPI00344BE450
MPRTVAPDAPELNRPDFASIRQTAAAELKTELDAIPTQRERRARAAEIHQQLLNELAVARPERDRLMVSLVIYQRPRAVHEAAGCASETQLRIVRKALGLDAADPMPPARDFAALGKDAGIEYVKDASAKLPDVAIQHEKLVARRRVVRDVLFPGDTLKLERQDFKKIKTDAADETQAQLTAIKDPGARLTEASRIARDSDAAYTIAAAQRDRCALSLEFYTRARAVDKAMGVARNAFNELRRTALGLDRKTGHLPTEDEKKAAAEAADIEFVEDAAERLPAAARQAAAARVRHLTAATIRNEAAAELHGQPSWDMRKIADVTGLEYDTIYAKVWAINKRNSK